MKMMREGAKPETPKNSEDVEEILSDDSDSLSEDSDHTKSASTNNSNNSLSGPVTDL